MEELVGRLMRVADIDAAAARRVIEVELAFLKDQGPPEKVAAMLPRLPGAAAIDTPPAGKYAGMMGAMAALSALQGAGLDMTSIRSATKEVLGYAREHAGAECVDDVVRAIPMLGQVV